MKSRPETRLEAKFRLYGLVEARFHVAEVLGRYSNDTTALDRMNKVVEVLRRRPTASDQETGSPRWSAHTVERRLSGEQKAALSQAYLAGESTPVLARRYGICENSVLAQLRRSGVPVRPGGKVTAADVDEMRQLRSRGLTYRAIGERYGITRTSVAKRLATRAE